MMGYQTTKKVGEVSGKMIPPLVPIRGLVNDGKRKHVRQMDEANNEQV